mgnify:CR=1 FL=1
MDRMIRIGVASFALTLGLISAVGPARAQAPAPVRATPAAAAVARPAYFDATPSLRMERGADGVLVVTFNTRGGPFRFSAVEHAAFVDAFAEARFAGLEAHVRRALDDPSQHRLRRHAVEVDAEEIGRSRGHRRPGEFAVIGPIDRLDRTRECQGAAHAPRPAVPRVTPDRRQS